MIRPDSAPTRAAAVRMPSRPGSIAEPRPTAVVRSPAARSARTHGRSRGRARDGPPAGWPGPVLPPAGRLVGQPQNVRGLGDRRTCTSCSGLNDASPGPSEILNLSLLTNERCRFPEEACPRTLTWENERSPKPGVHTPGCTSGPPPEATLQTTVQPPPGTTPRTLHLSDPGGCPARRTGSLAISPGWGPPRPTSPAALAAHRAPGQTCDLLPKVRAVASTGVHRQQVLVKAREEATGGRAVLTGLHDRPADISTGHVHVPAAIELVDHSEDGFVRNGPSQEDQVVLVRTCIQQASSRRHLFQSSGVCPAVDRPTPKGTEQHEACQLRLVLIDLRPGPIRSISRTESLESRPKRLRRGPLRRGKSGQPRLPCRLDIIHRTRMPHQPRTTDQVNNSRKRGQSHSRGASSAFGQNLRLEEEFGRPGGQVHAAVFVDAEQQIDARMRTTSRRGPPRSAPTSAAGAAGAAPTPLRVVPGRGPTEV